MMRRFSRALLSWLLPRGHRRVVLSHFDDEYEWRREREGVGAARRWYVAQATASLPGAGRLRMQAWGLGQIVKDVWQDAIYAVRQMRRAKAFTVAAVLMLAVGLGLVAGAYTIVNGIFIKGWNVPDNHEMFIATATVADAPSAGRVVDGYSYGAVKHLRAHSVTADFAAYTLNNFRIAEKPGDLGHYAYGLYVGDRFLDVIGIHLQRGAGFTGATSPEVIITDKVWHRMFGADPSVVGRVVILSGTPATIVGVLEPGFDALGERKVDAVVELRHASGGNPRAPATRAATDEAACCVMLTGRRREGVTADQVSSELTTLMAQYRSAIGQPALRVGVRSTAPGIPNDEGIGLIFGLLGAGVTLVWCLTCANVGNLFLARSLRRDREIAVRLSLGASRARLIRQLLTEGMVLAGIAGLLAFTLTAGIPVIMSRIDGTTSMFAPDTMVALVAALGTVLTCLVVALAPALQVTKIAWKGAGVTTTSATRGARDIVLAVQIAVAMVLVLSAVLITRGIVRAADNQSDFALRETSAATITLPADARSSRAKTDVFGAAVRRFAASDPTVALADWVPVSPGAGGMTSVQPTGGRAEFSTMVLSLSSAAFSVLDVPLLEGRVLSDDPGLFEAVVNQSLARQLASGGSPLGMSVVLGYDQQTYTIVGLARDTHLIQLGSVGPVIHVYPRITGRSVVLARTTPDFAERMTALAKELDPSATVEVTTLSAAVKGTLDNAWIGAATAGALGVLALILAVVGVFGVFLYLIEERRREIGLRLALGASRLQVRSALARACRRPVLLGLSAGLILSLVIGQVLRGYLFGLSPMDPVSFAAVGAVLLAAAVIATAVPVRRALRVDPAEALRAD